jgi:hypothetical protein
LDTWKERLKVVSNFLSTEGDSEAVTTEAAKKEDVVEVYRMIIFFCFC